MDRDLLLKMTRTVTATYGHSMKVKASGGELLISVHTIDICVSTKTVPKNCSHSALLAASRVCTTQTTFDRIILVSSISDSLSFAGLVVR